MASLRSTVIIATAAYSLSGIARLLGVVPVKPDIATYVQIADIAVSAALVTALLWPWIVEPFRCRHDTVFILRCHRDLASRRAPGCDPLWIDKHDVFNFAQCQHCGHVFNGCRSGDVRIYGERED